MNIRRRSLLAGKDYQLADSNAQPENILEKIIWHKEQEIAKRQESLTCSDVQQKLDQAAPVRDFAAALRESKHQPALIAEVKKASPSRGVIRGDFDPVAIAQAYERGGANCLSVLTDQDFFQGSFENLRLIRQAVELPLLCKEFIIDSYQIYLARLYGADAVLLIAAVLSDRDLNSFLATTHQLGMTALVEVHTVAELERVLHVPNVSIIGINNRNLETFSVDLEITKTLLAGVASDRKQNTIWVGESGLFTPQDLEFVASCGVNAVLVGESLVKQPDIEQAVKILLDI
jgi:indole-3-glycerol phosphate synthase